MLTPRRFTIDPQTGEVSTFCHNNCSLEFDRERISAFYITVTATDNGGRSNSTSVKVTLTDVNDNNPTFLLQEYLQYIKENQNVTLVQVKVRVNSLRSDTQLRFCIVHLYFTT